LARKVDLVFSTNWISGAIEFVGESAEVSGFKSGTNRVPSAASKTFLRLKVNKAD